MKNYIKKQNRPLRWTKMGGVICLLIFNCTLYAQMRTYVKTDGPPSYNVNPNDFTKNHMIMEFANGDSFLNVMAAQSVIGGYDYWTIRMTAIDENMDVLWSKDAYLTNGSGTRQSTTPFAICRSADGNGFVIAGIWDPSTQPMIGHLGIQHPFYMEVSTTGAIVQTYKGETGQIDQGYAPLSITPTSDGGYISVGVASSSMYTVTSNTMGYISKMNSSFVETNGKLVVSSFNSNSTGVNPAWLPYLSVPYSGQSQRFDAFNKIIPIQDGEAENYILTGTASGNLNEDNTSFYFGTAAISDGLICRIDQNLNLVWEQKVASHDNSAYSGYDGGEDIFNLVDVTYDEANDELFVLGNIVKYQGFINGGIVLRITGAGIITYSQIIDAHQLNFDNCHMTQIFIDDTYYYLCAFANSGKLNIPTSSAYSSLNPVWTKISKSSNVTQSKLVLDGDNENFSYSGFDIGYLGINYNPLIASNAPPSCCPQYIYNPANFNAHSNSIYAELNWGPINLNDFVIYFPASWYLSSHNGFVHTNQEFANNNQPVGLNPNFGSAINCFPAIYFDFENRTCDLFQDDYSNIGPIPSYNLTNNYSTVFLPKLTVSSVSFGDVTTNNILLPMFRCTDDFPITQAPNPLINEVSVSVWSNVNINNFDVRFTINYKNKMADILDPVEFYLYSIEGKLLKSGFLDSNLEIKNITNGFYVCTLIQQGQVLGNFKVMKY